MYGAGVDMVGMNRATIADPQLGRKARMGESGELFSVGSRQEGSRTGSVLAAEATM